MLALPSPFEGLQEFSALAILALIQGLTEFLPVSSSGHLVLAQSAMQLSKPGLLIDVALHVGTLSAIVIVYWGELVRILRDALRGRLREVGLIVLGSLPTALLGLGLRSSFEQAFTRPRWAAGGLLVTAVLLGLGELLRRRQTRRAVQPAGAPREPAQLSWGLALCIGTVQGLAIWPGVSRSGSTIATGLMGGLAPQDAARFSFLLSIPAVLGAALLSLRDLDGHNTPAVLPILFAVGLAGCVGWFALRFLLAFLARGAFGWFAAYCALVGAGYLALA